MGTKLVVSVGECTKPSILGVFQDEGDVARTVEVWDHLDVVSQAVIGQLLQLSRRERLRFDQRRRALVLEMSFQLDHETVDLEKRSLPDRMPQSFGTIEVMGIVPINMAELEVGPVFDMSLGKQKGAVAPLQQMHESSDSIEEPRRRIRED